MKAMISAWDVDEFEITEEHLKLMQRMYVLYCDDEFGAPCIDPKRPYGNSDVLTDISKILDESFAELFGSYPIPSPEQSNRFTKLHEETVIALQICLATLSFEAGIYIKVDKYDVHTWIKKP